MDSLLFEKSSLFKGLEKDELKNVLKDVPYEVKNFEKDEIVFYMMDKADRIGIITRGRVQAQKTFPNGSLINVSIRRPGDMIGAAAAFSRAGRYPCDIIALEKSEIILFGKDDLLRLMQRNILVLNNFTAEISSAAYMLQQRLELMSYSGIAQKAAFYLLMRARQTGKTDVRLPGTMSKWAEIMNVSRPSLHRELKKLEERRIIEYAPPFIKILDSEGLQDELGR